jgi:hypothetical protein
VTGAPKKGLHGIEHELGVYSQGGKGLMSRKTPAEIRERCERLALDSSPPTYASRMAAKVASAAVQDGYQLYHHALFFQTLAADADKTAPTLNLVAAEHEPIRTRAIKKGGSPRTRP